MSELVDLSGKVFVITGGARGIGGETARLVSSLGARVVIGDLLESEGQALVVEIAASSPQTGGEAVFCRTDVTREADCQRLVASAVERYGRLDVLICAAGILQGAFTAPEDLDPEIYARVLNVNVNGAFLTVRAATPALRKTRGVILLMASGAGVKSASSSLAYGSSKGAVHGLAMTMENHLAAAGIRVNDICPGAIDTEMKRENVRDSARVKGSDTEKALEAAGLASPIGVARVLAFLASDAASYVRGAVFTR